MSAKLPLLSAALLLAPALMAQKLELKLDSVIARAKEHNVVDLDRAQLGAFARLAAQKKPEKAEKAGQLLAGIEEVHVVNLEFDKDGQYSDADLEPVRKQLQAPGWSRIVSVKERHESTEVYLMTKDGKAAGLAVINAEARELNIVNIVGSISFDQARELVNSNIQYDLSQLRKPDAR